jgi:RNA polymerase sigma factor (sigma-70 family)
MLDAPKDSEIVRRILQGEANAFGLLLDQYKDHALKIIKKRIPAKDVEDIAQEVFVKAYQSPPGFDPDSHFKKWLSIIAVRTCCDYWRKAYRTRESPMSALFEGYVWRLGPGTDAPGIPFATQHHHDPGPICHRRPNPQATPGSPPQRP